MKITARQKIEDCLDGSIVFTYEMSEPWTGENVRALGALGPMEYFADFPRPYFRLRSGDGLYVNGVVGTSSCRVVLPRSNREAVERKWEETFM